MLVDFVAREDLNLVMVSFLEDFTTKEVHLGHY